MKRISTLAAVVAALAVAAPAASAAGPGQTCAANGNTFTVVTPGGPEPLDVYTRGACASSTATGDLSQAAYIANCKALTGGQYPFTFYGTFTARNPSQCAALLRGFHTGTITPPPPPGV